MFDKKKNANNTGMKEQESRISDKEIMSPPVSERENLVGNVPAMIGPTITIVGDVRGKEDLVIQGKVKGSVTLEGHLLKIGITGELDADLEATIVYIDGTVNGDIIGTEQVVVSKEGRIKGDIKAPRVTLEDGAKFIGTIDMDPEEIASKTAIPKPKAVKPKSSGNERKLKADSSTSA